MDKKKVPLNSLIKSKAATQAYYSNYGMTPPIWVPANTWLRVKAIDVVPVRGSRQYVCVDFYVYGLWHIPTVYCHDLGQRHILAPHLRYPEVHRASINYDEIAEVRIDGMEDLSEIPHFWTEAEMLGHCVVPQHLKDEWETLTSFSDKYLCVSLMERKCR